MSNNSGTTLVEVVVGSMLLVSVIGIVTLSLASVFEGYAMTQQRGSIDQDGQYILARLKYVASHQDSQTISSQIKTTDFTQPGYQSTNIEAGASEDSGIYLVDTTLSGEYTSPPVSLANPSLVSYFVASVKRPSGTSIKYRVAIARQVSRSCENVSYVFVGEDKSPNSFFTTDYFLIPTDNDGSGYENPGSCIRYKAYLTGSGGQTPVLYSAEIRR